ncbi:zinc finger, CCHC-type containing protein [Tanacetum coccineum]|uniref:Zinc finger, CCHC-type containing protein n=1 Tax=Tanacetum coccineum TaxID=301880 RepID=A0ABQ5E2K1_9ASTR
MTIRLILLAEKLTGSNFTNWYRNLRIVLRYEKKMKFVEQPIKPALDLETADPDTIDKYYETVNLEQEVACLMLSSMSPHLQRTLEKYNSYDMMKELKTIFKEQAKHELFEIVKAFHACKQEEGQSVSSYLLKIKSYLDTLEHLGYAIPNELAVSLILNSLNKDYDKFVQNYNMHNMGKTIAELHAILKLHEKGISKKAETPVVLPIREGKIQKDKRKPQRAKGKDKGKNKLAYAPKPKILPPPKKDNPAKDSVYHHYKEGLRRSKKLKHGSLSLYMGNGMRASVEAIGSFYLIHPCGLIIVLDNCHSTPTVTRGVVLISRLVKNDYSHTFANYGISVLKDNVLYFNAIPHDGIYEIDMHNLYPNVSSTFYVSNKRVKYSLDSSYLWHCRLGHINKKRMDKLQRDGILQPTHDELLEKCKSCISGKMAHNPFPHKGYALKSAACILNMVPTKKVKRKPYEIWHGKAPKLSYLRVWGCYPKETMGYYFYYPPENKIFVARNAEFFENSLIVQEASGSHEPLKMSGSDERLELIQEEDTQPSENTSEEHKEVVPIKEHELGDLNEPPNYKVALSDPEYDKWLEAMNTEMQSISLEFS